MSDAAKATRSRTDAASVRLSRQRSALGRARGLGAAHTGTGHWWAERATSVALVPLTLWFVYVAFHLAGQQRAGVAHFAANPLNAGLLLATVIITMHHMQLGLQVVVEDYIHAEGTRTAVLLAIKGAAILLALVGAVSVLKLALLPV